MLHLTSINSLTSGDHTMSREVLIHLVSDAWTAGYQEAVNALRDMVEKYGDLQATIMIEALTQALDDLKPEIAPNSNPEKS